MDSQLRLCRVCQAVRDEKGNGELVPIFEKSNKIAFGIFLISQVKVKLSLFGWIWKILPTFVYQIIECNSYRIPALICRSCIKDLSRAIKFRNRCRETDDFFKKTTQEVENLIWSVDDNLANGCGTEQDANVKQELNLDGQKIKDEPSDDFNVDLFENIDTILDDNLAGCEESNTLAGILGKAKREESTSDSSESEYEEVRERKRRSKKRSSDFRDFEMG